MTPLEALGVAAFVLAVVGLILGAVAIGVGIYVWWRYVYAPWRTMRADLAALNTKIDAVASQVSIQRIEQLSDAEVAFREARINARQRARHGAV